MPVKVLTERVESVAVTQLKEHPRNPNRGDLDAIEESINHNGFYGALVVQRSTGYILSGNHRWKAAQRLKLNEVPVIYVDVNDDQALRILLADNRTSELAHRDPLALLNLLEELDASRDGLAGLAYSLEDIQELRASAENEPFSDGADGSHDESTPDAKSLLDVVDVTVTEPKHTVHHGEVYQLGERMVLVIANPVSEMDKISPHFSTDSLFLPFAGGFIGFLDTPYRCVIAQPNLYIASYIIDRYKEAFGASAVAQVQ